MKSFDRDKMIYYPLKERYSKVNIERDYIHLDAKSHTTDENSVKRIEKIADEIIKARENNASVMLAFGAHTIKNGLSIVIGDLLKKGYITHLATNGAGVIHDWEFSYHGNSSEDVRANVQEGKFGTWEETGFYINLALAVGAYRGLGYATSVSAIINDNGLDIPSLVELNTVISESDATSDANKIAAAANLRALINHYKIPTGFMEVIHPYSEYSLLAIAAKNNCNITCHPMFGHDIIYTHKVNKGISIGVTAERDFLSYVDSVSNLENGVYMSLGSAVMSPMIFEKSLSMSRNVLHQEGKQIKNCNIHVADLAKETWDWTQGEPPQDNAAYYLRYMKTFSRMGCKVDYQSIDNRDFLILLNNALNKRS
ncbi:MAG: hypothetical protein ACPKNR_03535 [Pleomorphochaeta sp.]